MLNIAFPAMLVENGIKFISKRPSLNNTPVKLGVIAGGIATGMAAASVVANRFNDPNEVEPDRKLTAKDAIANIDDAMGALVLAKIPLASKLHFHRIVPAIFAWCGVRAGQSN